MSWKEVRCQVSGRLRGDPELMAEPEPRAEESGSRHSRRDAADLSRTDLTSWADLQGLAEGRTFPQKWSGALKSAPDTSGRSPDNLHPRFSSTGETSNAPVSILESYMFKGPLLLGYDVGRMVRQRDREQGACLEHNTTQYRTHRGDSDRNPRRIRCEDERRIWRRLFQRFMERWRPRGRRQPQITHL